MLTAIILLSGGGVSFAEPNNNLATEQDKESSAPTAKANNANIIYEFIEFTQPREQRITHALEKLDIPANDKSLIAKIPLLSRVEDSRHYRLAYAVNDNNKTLREVQVTRNNRLINFLITGQGESRSFKSHPSQIAEPEKNEQTATAIPANDKPSKTSTNIENNPPSPSQSYPVRNAKNWRKLSFSQAPDESLNSVLQKVNLSQKEQQLIQSTPIIRQAKTPRHFHLIFELDNNQSRYLKGFTVIRDNRRADFYRLTTNRLLSVNRLEGPLSKQLKRAFDKASLLEKALVEATTDKKTTPKSQQSNQPKSTQTSIKEKKKPREKYTVITFTQIPGQSISEAAKAISLSNLQQQLVRDIPVMKAAKSPRQFHLLFDQSGKAKYLKAVRVVRGERHAEFVLIKHTGKWFWANREGKIDVKETFLRYPLNYQRISSHFSMRRRHPITKKVRPHLGTDFKASTGTPIWAPADGVVTFAGRQSGYGKIIEIKHKDGYKTRYAHLSRILVKKGARVKQKQTIGKVGNTGLSTGPHLHYEVIVNGKHRNPLTVALPGGAKADTLAEAQTLAREYLPTLRQLIAR